MSGGEDRESSKSEAGKVLAAPAVPIAVPKPSSEKLHHYIQTQIRTFLGPIVTQYANLLDRDDDPIAATRNGVLETHRMQQFFLMLGATQPNDIAAYQAIQQALPKTFRVNYEGIGQNIAEYYARFDNGDGRLSAKEKYAINIATKRDPMAPTALPMDAMLCRYVVVEAATGEKTPPPGCKNGALTPPEPDAKAVGDGTKKAPKASASRLL